jgi:hypothetical protein
MLGLVAQGLAPLAVRDCAGRLGLRAAERRLADMRPVCGRRCAAVPTGLMGPSLLAVAAH